MKKIIWISGAAMAFSMVSCATIPVKPNIECGNPEECEVQGSFKAVLKRNAQYSLVNALLESTVVIDAASISLEISSTAGIPVTGFVDLNLIDSTNGSVQASGTFTWVKSGSDLVFSNPNAVNNWALANGGTADSMSYRLHPFPVAPIQGMNSMTVSPQIDGVTSVTATKTWLSYGGGGLCTTCELQ